MNRKKWLAAVVIVGILIAAFFWGGDFQKKTITTIDPITEVVDSTTNNEDSALIQGDDEVGDTIESEDSDEIEAGANDTDIESIAPESTDAVDSETKEESENQQQTKSDDTIAPTSTKPPVKPTTKPVATPKVTVAPNEPEKEKYETDPIPSGKPKPVEWQDVEIDKNKELTVTLSVSAETILNNLNIFNEDKLEVLPKDGIIYKAKKVVFYEGESVFDVLLREMKANKIHMEFEMTPIYNSNYIEGINNIYEFDCGELSGWMYKVNEWFPNYGASRYTLQDGDVVEWVYTCDLGRDVGGYVAGDSK
ncbi:DUF4430 domain-containing protein [Paenibacillus endoradicis]|uniref:DUF4430 domain-containing protein n=1 Tax=Paenibacillus endoradicis TaxID=2972487 RepID=UPI002159A58E|nr:DUF4430 domain-containing protein [Paenibacillus endoradicis]MCR8660410.1 DUF4430 domain-containing protein [Paenibacillus endoradicis]